MFSGSGPETPQVLARTEMTEEYLGRIDDENGVLAKLSSEDEQDDAWSIFPCAVL
jgi:hypothetical protein